METSLEKSFIAAIFLLIGFVDVAVNLLTIMVVLRTPQLRYSDQSQANLYVISLAVSDTLVGFSSAWFSGMYISETRAMMDSSYGLCLSGALVTSIGMTTSTITLIVISLDRLFYIVYPYFYQRVISDRLTKRFIIAVWCSSLTGASFFLFMSNNFETSGCKPLTVMLTEDVKIILTVSIIFQFLMTGACYLWIAIVVRSQQRKIQATSVHKPAIGDVNSKEFTKCLSTARENDKSVTRIAAADTATPDVSHTSQGQPPSGVAWSGVDTLHPSAASSIASPSLTVTSRREASAANVSTSASQNRTSKTVSVYMFFAINTVFSVSWIPLIISIFFDRGKSNDDRISCLVFLPVYLNSFLNFCIYAWKNIEYRNAYRKVLTNVYNFMTRK
ncbi:hypothetical protein C0Q70_10309 [Pomacea canaliculata]|uniref:G-protein coupled receptors family 1 profile domain-containing protein n=1 Tax=Pomacea canaliculata TaxID=400727 RepID=A0A2T7PC97_POMCA|nr:hypothetical protein C0Q70_10309 [Pomacea canaliculata]